MGRGRTPSHAHHYHRRERPRRGGPGPREDPPQGHPPLGRGLVAAGGGGQRRGIQDLRSRPRGLVPRASRGGLRRYPALTAENDGAAASVRPRPGTPTSPRCGTATAASARSRMSSTKPGCRTARELDVHPELLPDQTEGSRVVHVLEDQMTVAMELDLFPDRHVVGRVGQGLQRRLFQLKPLQRLLSGRAVNAVPSRRVHPAPHVPLGLRDGGSLSSAQEVPFDVVHTAFLHLSLVSRRGRATGGDQEAVVLCTIPVGLLHLWTPLSSTCRATWRPG